MPKPNPHLGVPDPLKLSKGVRQSYKFHIQNAAKYTKQQKSKPAKDEFFAAGRAAELLGFQETDDNDRVYWFEMAAKNYQYAGELGKAVGAYQGALRVIEGNPKRNKLVISEINRIESNITGIEKKIAKNAPQHTAAARITAAIAISALALSVIFGAIGLTGNAIINLTPMQSESLGALFFFVAILVGFIYLKKRK